MTKRKMLVGLFFFFLFLIHFTTSTSNQEDLSISDYSHIACLTLHSDKQYFLNYIQTNSLLLYQTYSSSNMTIELCFRLCRQWIILINSNHTTCICLYTMNEPYKFHEYLGEISSIDKCHSNDLQIYSLTNSFYFLPSLSLSYEWSFDGCYYLHGIQNYRADLFLTDVINHTQAIDRCRKHCQNTRNTNYFSFFLSLKLSCYCLPITTSKSILHTAVRKPLVHCSFLSYIKNRFDYFFNSSEIHSDTVVKIDVQRYCSLTFIFDRNLYLCLKLDSLNRQNTYSKINSNETCLPVLIKTYEQWNYLISFSFILNNYTLIWIDQNSTYIFDVLFKSKNGLLRSDDLCIVVNQTNSNRLPTFDLVRCSTLHSPGYVLCAQKPLETILLDKAEFGLIHNEEQYLILDNFTCPPEFVLFNNMCYYVDTSFVYNQTAGEDLCSNKYSNSSLVTLNSHDWGNINTTRFLGRIFDDILLEFFYYQLEKKIIIESKNDTNKKHWLRLLVVDKNPQNECILRYFIRSAGAFTILPKCDHGGHPVCQCESIRNNISKIISIDETTASSLEINNKTDLTTTTTLPILSTSTNLSIVSNETSIPNHQPISDEDLNNETNTDYKSDNNTLIQNKSQRPAYRPPLMMITGSLLALAIFSLAIVFLVRYFRRSRGSYTTHSNIVGSSRRKKRSSTATTSIDTSSAPSVLYSRLKSSPPSIIIDTDMSHPFDNSTTIDDNVQLLPQSINQIQLHENLMPEDEEEYLHATLKVHNEK